LIVVDASVLANAIADDTIDGDVARASLAAETNLAAPDLVDVETVSVLRKRWLADDLTTRRFRSAVADLADLAIVRYPALPFTLRAYELRANLTPYDALYVALAEALGCALLTSDTKLAASPGPRCRFQVLQT